MASKRKTPAGRHRRARAAGLKKGAGARQPRYRRITAAVRIAAGRSMDRVVRLARADFSRLGVLPRKPGARRHHLGGRS